jgi:Pyridoxamine 5'-phosphate oxidase
MSSNSKAMEHSKEAPFTFAYVETLLRTKNFGALTTITPGGKPHSVGVVYAVSPPGEPFCIYLITRPVLKKARNITNNPNVSFVVPFPHYVFRIVPPACIQFQGKAELIPIDNPAAVKVFQASIILRRSVRHSLNLGESTFVRIVPDNKIFSFGIGANIWQFLLRSKNKNLRNYIVIVPEYRRWFRE